MTPDSAPVVPFDGRHWLLESLGPLSDADSWNRLLQRFSPLWSLTDTRARIVDRVEESADTVSLWLRPNRRWQGHVPGQHLALGVEINGVRRDRVFSVSTAPRPDGLLRVTLQRQSPGGVTQWLHTHARKGLVVTLGEAGGDFVLPRPVEQPLLMVGAGSGITPLLAMLHELAATPSQADILLFQLYRGPEQRLFSNELSALSDRLPGLRIVTHSSHERGRLSPRELASSVPDLADRHTLVCGPEALMAGFAETWSRLGLAERLQMERFGAPRPNAGEGLENEVYASRSERLFTQGPGKTLLEAAEAAGLQPRYGCRAGICRTCLCQKRTGQVRNLLTGLVSSQPDEWVQLCISVAETDLDLSL